MIAVDSSALVAVVLGDDDAERFLVALEANPVSVSCASLVESSIVVEARQGPDASRDLDLLVSAAVDVVVPVDRAHVRAAVDGWMRFGKGRHPAGLNFGDCFSYALARVHGLPLLYRGEDFARTDVTSVL